MTLFNILSQLCLDLTKSNVQLPEVFKQQTKQYCSLLHALACKNEGKGFKRKRLVQAGGSFFSLLLPTIAGLVNIFSRNG